jgi:hypothetical protein
LSEQKYYLILEISPNPSFSKRGNSSLLPPAQEGLWPGGQREGRRDLIFNVYIIMD